MAHTVAIINGKQPSGGLGGINDADMQNLAVNIITAGIVAVNDYLVEQQASPNMTVKVNTGKAYVSNSDLSNIYQTTLDVAANVTITANSSGNSRIDAIVIKLDLGETSNNYANNIASLVAVAGTPAGSPVAPTDAEIRTAIGTGNPFYRLANVTVANGATSITTANIASTRDVIQIKLVGGYLKYNTTTSKLQFSNDGTTYTDVAKPIDKTWLGLSDGATITVDLSVDQRKFTVTNGLGGNRIIAVTNASNGDTFILELPQDGTGSRTVTWFNKSSTFATTDVDTSTEVITVNRNIPTTTPIKFSTSNTLPAGLSAATKYYAINVSASTIKVATTLANAQAGTAVNLTSQGTGTHTITTEIKWAGDIEPTLTTGKYRKDQFGIEVIDIVNGIYNGVIVGQDI